MRSSTERSLDNLHWTLFLVFFVLSPLLDPGVKLLVAGGFVLATCCVGWRTHSRYVDYVLVPLRPDQLPRNTSCMFDRWTPDFLALDCSLMGDFRLAYQPRPAFARYFLPPDRRIVAEVSDWDEKFVPGFTTIFDDGRWLETTRFPAHHSKNAEQSRLWFHCAADASVAELYAIHQRRIDHYESTYGARPLMVTPDRLLDIAQYGHRLVWWERNELPPRYGIPQVPAERCAEFLMTKSE
jgi:hypothetical protein